MATTDIRWEKVRGSITNAAEVEYDKEFRLEVSWMGVIFSATTKSLTGDKTPIGDILEYLVMKIDDMMSNEGFQPYMIQDA